MKTRSIRSAGRGIAGSRGARVQTKAFARLLRGATKRASSEKRPMQTERREAGEREIPAERRRASIRPEPRDDREEREVRHDARREDPLEPFSPLPAVIASSSPTVHAHEPAATGTNWDRAQVAAMAERMLSSFRTGHVDGREEARMHLRALDAEVRVRVEDGRVLATLVGDGLDGLASTLQRELRERGLESEITLVRE